MPLLEIGPEGISVSATIRRRGDDTPLVRSTRQAGNLRQAHVGLGMRVLEIGSGGPNAAMLAHLVGPDGEVVTVDIDESVTARTTAGLERLGLSDRVEVITADAGRHLGRGVFDRIMVTVSPWTIPKVWLEQLAPDGVLVVPLQIAPGLQRIIGFRYQDGHLISESTVPGGFVPLQGANRYEPPAVELTGLSGKAVTFRFADQIPDDFAVTDGVLAAEHAEAWSGVIYASRTIWLDLLTWVLIQPGGCAMEAKDPTDRGAEKSFYPAITEAGSFAALAWRPLGDGNELEIGAVGKGPAAGALTTRLAESIQTYGADHRECDPIFEWWPEGATPDLSPSAKTLPRPHGMLTISWPARLRRGRSTLPHIARNL